jgi:glycosyltransferase involved in cell wall biosynthesis
VLSLSSQPESFGRTTLEALRLGVPTAGYDHGGVGEILRAIYPDGLLERDDIGAATEKIITLLKHPRAIPDEDFFPLRNMLAKTLEVYQRLAQVPPDQT